MNAKRDLPPLPSSDLIRHAQSNGIVLKNTGFGIERADYEERPAPNVKEDTEAVSIKVCHEALKDLTPSQQNRIILQLVADLKKEREAREERLQKELASLRDSGEVLRKNLLTI